MGADAEVTSDNAGCRKSKERAIASERTAVAPVLSDGYRRGEQGETCCEATANPPEAPEAERGATGRKRRGMERAEVIEDALGRASRDKTRKAELSQQSGTERPWSSFARRWEQSASESAGRAKRGEKKDAFLSGRHRRAPVSIGRYGGAVEARSGLLDFSTNSPERVGLLLLSFQD
jgi:hypothetical protein